MRRIYLFLLLAVWSAPARGWDVCDPDQFGGPYGFLLSGQARISGAPQPAATVGRIVFDRARGVTGYASTMFAGLLLGNPVTGRYEVRTDCSISWSLQDDSGNFQYFKGVVTHNGNRVQFRQTDPGSPQTGIMIRAAESCPERSLVRAYRYSISGFTVALETGQSTGSLSASGLLSIEQNGNIEVVPDPNTPGFSSGKAEVQEECFVQLRLVAAGESSTRRPEMNFRGILANGGRELLGIQLDPGTAVTLKLTAP